ncbi:hypothetical protein [Chitinibacter sp. ZOR0017]|uniref:hypothetical protein n=1 Tax=Chitinibacter sp. ZOR0017 TaxID=1339254 RepID=UPI0006464F61|nr:hypothetical protein [Chitinibacter sp. ZOR0017]
MSVLIFHDDSYPQPGEQPPDLTMPVGAQVVAAQALSAGLDAATMPCVLLHLHGPYFPSPAWPALQRFLARGGHLVSLGEQAFSAPVDEDGYSQPRAALFRQLDIQEIQTVALGADYRLAAGRQFSWLSEHLACFTAANIRQTDSFVLMPTKHKDQPQDSGSAGPMDARIYSLLQCQQAHPQLDLAAQHSASPVVMIERLRGEMAGSRQIFVNLTPNAAFWQHGGMAMLLQLARHALCGVTEWWLKPDFACYEPGEMATLTLQAEALGAAQAAVWQAKISVLHHTQQGYIAKEMYQNSVQLDTHDGGIQSLRFTLPTPIQAGRYSITVELSNDLGDSQTLQQGFWGRDQALLARGSQLRAGRDYFERDGEIMPIVGMTYMASDVHRKFLQLPNVALWQQDMATLKAMGVNYIRTGIWSAWRQLMFVDGHAQEALLRAIDAFIHTAASLDLECCFTFFAFTPEAWEGANPYLDPRSRAAQKRFIRSIVARHIDTKRVHWDLINEPSLFDPARIFVGPRSLGDADETRAFVAYLQGINADIRHWQSAWDLSPSQLPDWSAVRAPQPDDIGMNTTEIRPKQHGIWLDYALFTQAAHRAWAADLASSIRQIAPHAMVCVGQDEALGQQRPHPFFYADVVDYTSVHSWWLNDALAWDSLFSKTPQRPNLVQETGIMHVERADGRSRRSEAELMQLLERKYAYAYSYGNAGAVHWIWNCNYHMDNLNESHIGACRADGSQKPEAAITAAFGDFFAKTGVYLQERELADIAVIYPFNNDYSNRRSTLEATQNLVRQFGFELGHNLRAVSDQDFSHLHAAPPKLIIWPAPQNIAPESWQALSKLLAEQPITVLLTGPATLDQYFRACPRPELTEAHTRNLSREEQIDIAGHTYRASFGGECIARLDTGCGAAAEGVHVQRIALGRGQIIWSPLPLEHNARPEPLLALYQHVLQLAQVTPDWQWLGAAPIGVFLQAQHFAAHTLWIAINESQLSQTIAWQDTHTQQRYQTQLPAGRARLWLTDARGVVNQSLWQHPVECIL